MGNVSLVHLVRKGLLDYSLIKEYKRNITTPINQLRQACSNRHKNQTSFVLKQAKVFFFRWSQKLFPSLLSSCVQTAEPG